MKKIGLLFCVLLLVSVNNAIADKKMSANDLVSAIESSKGTLTKKGLSDNAKIKIVKEILVNRTELTKLAKGNKSVKNMIHSVDVQIAQDAGKVLGKILVSDEIAANAKLPVMLLMMSIQENIYKGELDVKASIKELGRIMVETDDYTVQELCAKTLSIFVNHKKEASVALITGLERHLQVKEPQFKNIRVTNTILNSLMVTRHKSAFIVLIKVLQGAYPPPTKITAQQALDAIIW